MYNASKLFTVAMKTRPYTARLTLDDADVIEGEAIQGIVFRGGTNGEQDAFTLGGTVAGSVEISLDKAQVSSVLHGRKIKVELGIDVALGTQWLPMGVYYVTEPLADDDRLTVTAFDALAVKFEKEYKPIPGFDFSLAAGVSSTAFLSAVCERSGVPVDISNLEPIMLHASPDGFTERQIIGFIAALYGAFACIDRTGVLKICSFNKTDVKVTADEYYQDGMEKAEYSFSVQWLKCYNEASELTMIMGDASAQQGVYLESIWMDYKILANLWDKLQGFTYVPVADLSFFGNPLIDAGDIITMEDLSGTSVTIPVMHIEHEYDGGIITKVVAYGQAETTESVGLVGRQIQRVAVKAKTYADDLDKSLDQMEVLKRLTADGTDDAVYITKDGKLAIKATAILTGVINADLIKTGTLNADLIKTGTLNADLIKTGTLNADLIKGGTLDSSVINGATLKIEAGASIVGWQVDNNSICKRTADGSWGKGTFMCTGSDYPYRIGGSDEIRGWVFGAGGKFGVRSTGEVWCSDLHATGGDIGGWNISEKGLSSKQWQSESNITKTETVINMTGDYLRAVLFDAHEGTIFSTGVSWSNIVACVQEWCRENDRDYDALI